MESFRQALHERGYVEGQNVAIEYRYAEGKLDQLPIFAAELVQLKVDVIVGTGIPPIRAAQQATKTIPIVMTNVPDPVASGFVFSLAKPGGNITGLTQMAEELSGKRLELLKESFPKVSRVGVFVNTVLTAEQRLVSLQPTANVFGIKLQSLEVSGAKPDFDGALRTATSERVEALLIQPGPILSLHRRRVVDIVEKSRLPAMYPQHEFVEIGGLMSYGPDYADLYRRAAAYVDKLLKGTKPADLPVERPTKFEFVVNLKTAKQIGLPPNVLARADKIIR